MDWKEYEEQVLEALKSFHIDDTIIYNHKIKGIYSNRSRQIDIYVEQKVGDKTFKTIIDCKNYKTKVDIKKVESFISMVEDVGGDYGILISENGFTKSANNRAFKNPKNIELDIYNFEELTHHLQAKGALPYSGENMVILHAPFGWIVDAKKRNTPAICFLYKRGLTFEEAKTSMEFSYVNFWDTKKEKVDAKTLSESQVEGMKKHYDELKIEYEDSYNTLTKTALIRKAHLGNKYVEITGFIEFSDFIFFCVCFTPELYLKRNLRKMHLLLRYILPIKIEKKPADNKA